MCDIDSSTSVASEHPISSPGAGGEYKVVPYGWKQMGKAPSSGSTAQKHPEPGGIWPIPAVVYIWGRMEMAAGHLCSLCIAKFPFCFAEPQHNNLHLQTNYNTPLNPDSNWEGRIWMFWHVESLLKLLHLESDFQKHKARTTSGVRDSTCTAIRH